MYACKSVTSTCWVHVRLCIRMICSSQISVHAGYNAVCHVHCQLFPPSPLFLFFNIYNRCYKRDCITYVYVMFYFYLMTLHMT